MNFKNLLWKLSIIVKGMQNMLSFQNLLEKDTNFLIYIFRNNFSENTGIKLHSYICFISRD
jgi:hypothetical protein